MMLLIAQYSLYDTKLTWMNSLKHMGLAIQNKKRDYNEIALSIEHAMLGTESEFIDTVMHEIAHINVGTEYGHANVWKKEAKLLGVNINVKNTVKPAYYYPFYEEVDGNYKYYRNRIHDNVNENFLIMDTFEKSITEYLQCRDQLLFSSFNKNELNKHEFKKFIITLLMKKSIHTSEETEQNISAFLIKINAYTPERGKIVKKLINESLNNRRN